MDKSTEEQHKPKKKNKKKIFIIVIGLSISSVIFLISMLPYIVSTTIFRQFIEKKVTTLIHRPFSIERLNWKWAEGVTIENIVLKDAPSFSDKPLLYVREIRLLPQFRELISRTLNFELSVETVQVHLIRNRMGKTNIEAILESFPSSPDAKPKQDKPGNVNLPVDVVTHIQLKNMDFSFRDEKQNQTFELVRSFFYLRTNSIRNEPTTTHFSGRLSIDNQPDSNVFMDILAGRFLDRKGNLRPTSAQIEVEGEFPGVRIQGAGDMGRKVFDGNIYIDLKQLHRAMRPLIPAEYSDSTVEGFITAIMKTAGDPLEALTFDTEITMEGLKYSGSLIGVNPFGPLRFHVINNGVIDIPGNTFTIRKGRMEILHHTVVQWRGELNDIDTDMKKADFHLDHASFDLIELMDIARPFLPENLTIDLGQSAMLDIRNGAFSGGIPTGDQTLSLRELNIDIPSVRVKNDAVEIGASDFLFSVHQTAASFTDFLPNRFKTIVSSGIKNIRVNGSDDMTVDHLTLTRMEADVQEIDTETLLPGRADITLSGRAENVRKKGGEDISVTLVDLKNLTVTADRFTRSDTAPMGLTCRFDLNESLFIDGIVIPSRLNAEKIEQSFKCTGELLSDNVAEVAVDTIMLSLPSIEVENPSFGKFKTNVNVGTRIPRILVKRLEPLEIDIDDVSTKLSVSDYVKAEIKADAENLAKTRLTCEGVVDIDLSNLYRDLPNAFSKDIKMKGGATLGWDFQGRLPNEEELKTISKLVETRNPEFVDHLTFRVDIKDTDLKYQLSPSDTLDLQHIASGPVIEYRYGETRNKGKLNGGISINKVNALPVVGRLKESLPLFVTFEAAHSRKNENIRFNAKISPLFDIDFRADMEGLGKKELQTDGKINIDLDQTADYFSAVVPEQVRVSGNTKIGWNFSGRLPDDKELEKLTTGLPNNLQEDLPFLGRCDFSIEVLDMDTRLGIAENEYIEFNQMYTEPNISYHFDRAEAVGVLGGKLRVKQIHQMPYIGKIEKPLGVNFSFSFNHEALKTLKISQLMEVQPLNIKETIDIAVYHIDRLLRKGKPLDLSEWMKTVGLQIQTIATIPREANLNAYFKEPKIEGGAEFGMVWDLSPNQHVRTENWLNISNMDLSLRDVADINDLEVNFDFEHRYRIQSGEQKEILQENALSDRVMEPEARSAESFQDGSFQNFLAGLQRRYGANYAVTLKSMDLKSTPVPLTFENVFVDFNYKLGLPAIDFFQADLLGGTVMGSFSANRKNDRFTFKIGVKFSGINAGKIFPGQSLGIDEKETEISGQLSLIFPLEKKLQPLLRDLEVDILLTHIGSRFLERLLYAMDPYESNESIVSQRKLLKTATPQWVRIGVKYGNLSLFGKAKVKGVTIDIPPIRRINIANLPGLEAYEIYLEQLTPVIETLKITSSNVIKLGKNGHIEIGSEK